MSGGRGNNFKTEVEEMARFFCFPPKETKAAVVKGWGNIKTRYIVLGKGKNPLLIKARHFAKGMQLFSSTTTI